jgi:hypothetical protein
MKLAAERSIGGKSPTLDGEDLDLMLLTSQY